MYENELGIKGNIDKALNQIIQERNNTIISEAQLRDTLNNNIILAEQEVTDLYLDNIEAQQEITELELMILGG